MVTHRLVYETWGEDTYLCERTADHDTSKSSASSRAIPFPRMVAQVEDDPYTPVWTLQQKGMQGRTCDDARVIQRANDLWLDCLDYNAHAATRLHEIGVHKQDCNRLLEPWAWVTQVVTSSRWDNFFGLRCHHKAFPPFRRLARMMYLARRKVTPRRLDHGEWHLPFVKPEEKAGFKWIPDILDIQNEAVVLPDLIKKSAARCAWVSYENHDRDASDEAHFRTFDALFAEVPVHGGPVEHQATPMHSAWEATWKRLRSNLAGYLQARKLVRSEVITDFSPTESEVAAWDDVPAEML